MSPLLTRILLGGCLITALVLTGWSLVPVQDALANNNCFCPSFWNTTGGWGHAATCAEAEANAVANAHANATAACGSEGLCDIESTYTITGACHPYEPDPTQMAVDVERRYKCFICMD